jgi:hypothetical protein
MKIFFLGLLLFFSIPLCSAVNQNNDVQLWITEAVHKKITSRSTLHLYNEWRFGDDISKLYFFYVQGVLGTEVNRWLNVGPGYRQIWEIRASQWRLTYEPFGEALIKMEKGSFEFQFRNRVSYIMREKETDFWLYRGRLRWVAACNLKGRTYRPYFSNEIFLHSQNGFSQDRIAGGILVPLVGSLLGDFYYMIRFQKSHEHWTHQHIFGTWFNLYF